MQVRGRNYSEPCGGGCRSRAIICRRVAGGLSAFCHGLNLWQCAPLRNLQSPQVKSVQFSGHSTVNNCFNCKQLYASRHPFDPTPPHSWYLRASLWLGTPERALGWAIQKSDKRRPRRGVFLFEFGCSVYSAGTGELNALCSSDKNSGAHSVRHMIRTANSVGQYAPPSPRRPTPPRQPHTHPIPQSRHRFLRSWPSDPAAVRWETSESGPQHRLHIPGHVWPNGRQCARTLRHPKPHRDQPLPVCTVFWALYMRGRAQSADTIHNL